MEVDSPTRMRERAFGPRTEKLKSQQELRDRISSEFSIGVSRQCNFAINTRGNFVVDTSAVRFIPVKLNQRATIKMR